MSRYVMDVSFSPSFNVDRDGFSFDHHIDHIIEMESIWDGQAPSRQSHFVEEWCAENGHHWHSQSYYDIWSCERV